MNEMQQLQDRITKLENLLSGLILSDRYAFEKNIQILDGRNIQVAKGTGTTIATETTQKIGFYGKTTVQASAITPPSGGSTTDAQARTAIDSIITALHNFGIIG